MTLKEQFEQNGWVGPIEIMSREEALEMKKLVLEAEEKINLMNSDYRCKSNVLFPFVDRISRSPKLIEALTQLIGPNIHCWDTLFWVKKPGDGKDVSFHQDATYWNYDKKHLSVTAWFAFDDVTEEHGSIEYVQGSHKVFQRRHKDVRTDTNLLMRGQTVDEDLPKERVKTRVPAGHVLLHSPYIIHGSGPNQASTPRVAMGMILASTECKPILNIAPESTVMVAGVDEYNYMLHDPAPTGDWEVDKVNWRKAYDRQHDNYYKMEQTPASNPYAKMEERV
jgi:ectoine hydroxylase-related dioxygenase (phytanoyl-CoA dioxygenase family)